MGHDFRANYYDAAAHQSLRPRLARAGHGPPENLSRVYGENERLYSEVAEERLAPSEALRLRRSVVIHPPDELRALCVFKNPAAFDAGRDTHRLPIFGHCSARNIYALISQELNNLIVRNNCLSRFFTNQNFNLVTNRFR